MVFTTPLLVQLSIFSENLIKIGRKTKSMQVFFQFSIIISKREQIVQNSVTYIPKWFISQISFRSFGLQRWAHTQQCTHRLKKARFRIPLVWKQWHIRKGSNELVQTRLNHLYTFLKNGYSYL